MPASVRLLLGGGGASVVNNFNGADSSSFSPTKGPSTATITFANDGSVNKTVIPFDGGSTVFPTDWYLAHTGSIGSSYWIRATLSSGTSPTTGSIGTWLSLSSGYAWSLHANTGSIKTCTLFIEIASDSGGVNIATNGYVSLDADASGGT